VIAVALTRVSGALVVAESIAITRTVAVADLAVSSAARQAAAEH
jgi:hypothetical protein